jgi:uncharacterized membrane protein
MQSKIYKAGFYLLVVFYGVGGINHFINLEFYLPLIPDYLGDKSLINTLAGLAELILAGGLLIRKTRKLAVYGILLMLIAFIPSHVYFIQIGGCVPDGLCAPVWVGWVRLVIIHPLLMLWAWIYRDF